MADPKLTLYNLMVDKGKYTRSYNDFREQFSTPEKMQSLYDFSKKKENADLGLTMPLEDFQNIFFPEFDKKKVNSEPISDRDFGQDGVEAALSKEKTPEDVLSSLKLRTPLEMGLNEIYGKPSDPTYKEYLYEVAALSEDSDKLMKGLNHVDENIKNKYGEDFFSKLAEVYERVSYSKNAEQDPKDVEFLKKLGEDPIFEERDKIVRDYNKNAARFKEFNTSDNYKTVRELMKTFESIQKDEDRIDNDPGVKKWDKWVRHTGNIVTKSMGRFLGNIGALMDMGENLIGEDKKFTKWDVIEQTLLGVAEDAEKVLPAPTRFSRPISTITTKYNDLEVDFQDDKIISVRDKKGRAVDTELTKDQIEEIKALPRKRQMNWSSVPYQTAQVISDFAVQMAVTGGISKGLGAVGVTGKANSIASVTAGTAGMMSNTLYTEGLEIFNGDKNKAAQYAAQTGMMIGLASTFFGLEARFATGGKGLVDDMLFSAPGKGASIGAAAANKVKNMMISGLGEAIEESIIEQAITNANKVMLNGESDGFDTGEMINAAVPAFITGILFGAGAKNPKSQPLRDAATLTAINNPEGLQEALTNAKEEIDIDDAEIAKTLSDIQKMGAQMEAFGVEGEENQLKAIPKLKEINELRDKADKMDAVGAKEEAKKLKEKAMNLEASFSKPAPSIEIPSDDDTEVEIDQPKRFDIKSIEEQNFDLTVPFMEVFDLSQEEASANAAIYNAVAETWAEKHGKTKEEWYQEKILGVHKATEREIEEIVSAIDQDGETKLQIIGENAANKKPFLKKSLRKAKRFEKLGWSSRKIFDRTGWEKGVDGKWRYDLHSDDGLTDQNLLNKLDEIGVKNPKTASDFSNTDLDKILDNKFLFKLYPELKDIDLVFIRNQEWPAGSFDKGGATEFPGLKEGKKRIIVNMAKTGRRILSSIIHEVQHAIQSIEGFLQGSNNRIVTNEEYLRSAGEVEARNAERRQSMGGQYRRNTPISQTEDIDRSRQVKVDISMLDKDGNLKIDETFGQGEYVDGELQARGAISRDESGQNIIYALTDPDASTPIHELAHIFENDLDPDEIKTVLDWTGEKKWNRDVSEKFARGFEKYLSEGIAPTEKLKAVFESFKKWLTNIYNGLIMYNKGEIELNDQMRDLYSKVLAPEYTPGVGIVATGIAIPAVSQAKVDRWVGAMKKFLRKTFTARGLLNREIHELSQKRTGRIKSQLYEITATGREWKGLLKEVYGTDQLPPEILQGLNEALQTSYYNMKAGLVFMPDGTKVDPRLHGVLAKMRSIVDGLSTELIDSGMIDDSLKATIGQNLGFYLTRSYRVHDDGDWRHKVSEDHAVWAKARRRLVKVFRNQHREESIELAKAKAKLESGKNNKFYTKKVKRHEDKINQLEEMMESEEKLDAVLDGMLKDQSEHFSHAGVAKKSKLGAKDFGIFKARKDIPSEFRALFGEYQDPMINFSKSIFKMVHLLENHRFLNDVRTAGQGKWLFEESQIPNKKYNNRIAAESSSVMAPLNGVYTTEEIKTAFEEFNKSDPYPAFFRHFIRLGTVAKYSKTILSPVTHMRNFVMNWFFHFANGHLGAGQSFAEARKIVREDLFGKGKNAEAIAKIKRLTELGVIRDSATYEEMKALIRDSEFMPFDNMLDNKVLEYSKKIAKNAETWYQAEDDFHKIISFYTEGNRYSQIRFGKPMSKLDAGQLIEIEEFAADLVQRIMPNYTSIPQNIKAIRVNPFIGTFVSFPYEVIRNTKESLVQGVSDVKEGRKTGNKKLTLLGAKRIGANLALMTSIHVAAKAAFASLGYEDEDEDKIRKFLPSWSRESVVIPVKRNGADFTYIDVSSVVPQGYIMEMISALDRSDRELSENLERFLFAMRDPFTGEDMTFTKIREVMNNRKDSGQVIVNEDEGELTKALAKLRHIGEAGIPGFVTTGRRIIKSLTNPELDYYGRLYPELEVLALVPGVRVTPANLEGAFNFMAADYFQRIQDARSIYYKVRNKKTSTDKDVETAKEKASELYRKAMQDAVDAYQDGIKLGASPQAYNQILKDKRFSGRDRKSIRMGLVLDPVFK